MTEMRAVDIRRYPLYVLLTLRNLLPETLISFVYIPGLQSQCFRQAQAVLSARKEQNTLREYLTSRSLRDEDDEEYRNTRVAWPDMLWIGADDVFLNGCAALI